MDMKHGKTTARRFLSALLALVMCIGMLPGTALAADTKDTDVGETRAGAADASRSEAHFPIGVLGQSAKSSLSSGNVNVTDGTGNLVSHPGEGTITIEQATPGMSYMVYRLFNVESTDSGLVYTINVGNSAEDAAIASQWNYFCSVANGETSALHDYVEFEELSGEDPDVLQVKWPKGDMSEDRSFALSAVITFRQGLDHANRQLDPVDYASYLEEYDYQVFGSKIAQGTKVVFSGLPFGYYIVGSSAYSPVILYADQKEVNTADVSSFATAQKCVWENSVGEIGADGPTEEQILNGAGWGSTNDADIGDTVWFKTTVQFGDAMWNDLLLKELVNLKRMTDSMYGSEYVDPRSRMLFDAMDVGLEWNNGDEEGTRVLNAYLKDAETGGLEPLDVEFMGFGDQTAVTDFRQAKEQYYPLNYKVKLSDDWPNSDSMLDELLNIEQEQNVGARDGINSSPIGYGISYAIDDFHTFGCYFYGYCDPQDEIILIYSAKVTPHAAVGQQGNKNYTQVMNRQTRKSSTTTYVHQFDLVKTDSAKTLLPGAEFELLDASGNAIPLVYCEPMREEADREWFGAVNFREFMYGTASKGGVADGAAGNSGSGTGPAAGRKANQWPNAGPGANPMGAPRDFIWDNDSYEWIPRPGGEAADQPTGFYRPATEEERKADGFVPAVIYPYTVDNPDGKTWMCAAIQGLDSGIYFLRETATPEGYNEPSAPHMFKLAGNHRGRTTLNFGNATEVASKAVFAETDGSAEAYEYGGLQIVNFLSTESPTGANGSTVGSTVGNSVTNYIWTDPDTVPTGPADSPNWNSDYDAPIGSTLHYRTVINFNGQKSLEALPELGGGDSILKSISLGDKQSDFTLMVS